MWRRRESNPYWNPTIVGSHYVEAAGIEPAWVRWSYQDFSALDPFAPVT